MKAVGLGFLQGFLKKEFIVNSIGGKFYYDPRIRGSYDYLLIGKSNEPETHMFLKKIIPFFKEVNFIDIGASVGEFVNGVCIYSNVNKIYAFEPRPECSEVIKKNAELNNETRIIVQELALSEMEGEITFYNTSGGTSSGIFDTSNKAKKLIVRTKTLDSLLNIKLNNVIMLIDVEGAELRVLSGAKEFIMRNNPLIIFEYNHISKRFFNLDEIALTIGSGYKIFRLKGDGYLDLDFSNSWNCVAVHDKSEFMELLNPLFSLGN